MIAVLAPHVIDQIAAGEVIERPASVVKELVDNAIDAEARSIAVDVAAGGRGLIRVSDDGRGMSPKDAVLALERHATSKLREVDDLWELSTMGFRGEALPSIASVSRMTLTTRRTGDDAATRIVIEAGRLVSVSEAGAPVGTTVEVADLLSNVPARLKFLKGEATEASHITELLGKIAMAYPRLHVRLRHNGRTALDAPPDRDGFARAQALLGPRIAARVVPVSGEESGVRVTAYLGAPELAQATARGIQLFVGRRPVRDRGLLHALAMGYGELVPRGRYPFAIVLLDAPSGTVDINVHPQKLEVRFSDPAVVCAAVRHVVQAGVAAARWRDDAAGGSPVQLVGMIGTLPGVAPPLAPHTAAATPLAERHAAEMQSRQGSLGFERSEMGGGGPAGFAGGAGGKAPRGIDPAPEIRATRGPIAAPRAGTASPRDWARSLREQTQASRAAEEPAVYRPSSGVAEDIPRLPSLTEHARQAMDRQDAEPGADPVDASAPALPLQLAVGTAPIAPAPAPHGAGFFAQLRYLGQLDLTYLACEGEGELVLVDQHAAHERVELARLRERHARGGDAHVAVQNMLFPVTLDVTPAQLALVARLGELLAQVGFEVEPFGKATLAVKAVPAGIRHGDPTQLLRRLLHDWAEAGAPSEAERLDALLGTIACHSVVRAGDRLAPGEVETLLRSLDGIDPSLPAPHGRAVLLRLPLSEIGRRFGRS